MASQRLTSELLVQATSGGCGWLAEQAAQGRLLADYVSLRRLAWAHIFGIISGETSEDWVKALEVGRKRYNGLLEETRRERNVKALDPNVCNPLARNSDNPFNKMQANDELLKEIWKDVERTFPEVEMLSSADSRKMLQRLLFHWCRATNPAKAACDSYRQGMNELAAVMLAACKWGEYAEGSWETPEALGLRLCGRQHTEADAFTLFSRLMDMGLRPMFMPTSSSATSPIGGARNSNSVIGELPRSRLGGGSGRDLPPSSAILARCMFIFDTVVKRSDLALHKHLLKLEIEPQVFLLRWLRLLFCREFSLEDTLLLWDGFFADAYKPPSAAPSWTYPEPAKGGGEMAWREAAEASAKMPLVDYVAAAFLRGMRGDLLGLDQTDCLRRLLSARPPACGVGALLDSARRLRDRAASMSLASPVVGADAGPFGGSNMAGGAGNFNAPPRGQHLLSAAALGAQGLFSAAVQKISEQLPPMEPTLSSGSVLGSTDELRRLLSARPPACGVGALLDSARRLRDCAASMSLASPAVGADAGPLGGSNMAANFGSSLDPFSSRPGQGPLGGPPGSRPLPVADVGAAGGAGNFNAPPRGQHLLSAAALGAQGLFSAAVQKISEQLPPMEPTLSSGSVLGSTEELRRRLVQAEQERDTIKRKANEFVTAKRAEWASQVNELKAQLAQRDQQLAERDARIAELEAHLRQAGEALRSTADVSSVSPAPALVAQAAVDLSNGLLSDSAEDEETPV
eukprot:CAMPEP_0203974740 /NCGR_PEP_ID=MMETSP0359-20131031/100256_1 /ASSEMBLY_ACC=CAM_ASM_000338 /TAXON_ID=268821 /ORGANISM="Scrippsiella Hangoei, Strain SHTV-5" /LENGTH=742 /DNA_ID=CAMNT_0050912927 /DNA_START=193 /DNA_END=2421 /DNA_ORIENTATION=+